MTGHPARFAFVGKAGSGKTFLADYCQETWGCKRLSFAKMLKEVAKVKADIPRKDWHNVLYKMAFDLLQGGGYYYTLRVELAHALTRGWIADFNNASTTRELLQKLGTDTGRKVDEDLWVRAMERDMERYGNSSLDYYVVDDVRFLNEAKFLREKGFILVRVDAPVGIRVDRLRQGNVGRVLNEHMQQHASETEQDQIEVHYTLDNSENDGGKLAFRQLEALREGKIGKPVYLALHTDEPTEGSATEVTDADYARQPIATAWTMDMKNYRTDVYMDPQADAMLTPEAAFEEAIIGLKGIPLERFSMEVVRYDDGSIGYDLELMTEPTRKDSEE